MSAVRVEWRRGPGALASLRDDWNALAGADSPPFAQHSWFEAAFAAFKSRNEAVLAVWDGPDLAAAVPVHLHRNDAVAPIHHEASPYCPPVRPAAVATAAAELLRADVRIEDIPVAHPLVTALTGRRSRLVLRRESELQPLVDLRTTWPEYRAAMKSHWRSLEQTRRKMSRNFDVAFRLVETPDDPTAQLRQGLELEAAGWKGRNGTAILQRAADLRFYSEVVTRFHDSGQLRVSELTLDGELVAWDITLLSSNRLYGLKAAYAEAHHSLSPGLVLRLAIIERCFELDLDAHELGGADDPWKRRFANGTNPLCTLDIARPLPRGVARQTSTRAYGAARAARRWASPRLRRLASARGVDRLLGRSSS